MERLTWGEFIGLMICLILIIFCFIILKEFFFPTRTKSQQIADSKAKLEEKLAVLKKQEEEDAEQQRMQQESRICPRMSTRTDDKYGSYFRKIWCHQGVVYSWIKGFTKQGECAMASECPGAYHQETSSMPRLTTNGEKL